MLVPRKTMDAAIAGSPDRHKRIFSMLYQGSRVWVKRGAKNYTNRFQNLVGEIATLPLRRLGPARTRLYIEVTRIRALRRAGIRVPRIVSIGDDYVVLADAGVSLVRLPEGERVPRILEAARVLADMHNAGQWHGNAKLRNFVLGPDGVAVIDLEEPVGGLPGFYKRLTDLHMMMSSALRLDPGGPLAADCLRAYRERRSLGELYVSSVVMLPVYALLLPLGRFSGSDGRALRACLTSIYWLMLF